MRVRFFGFVGFSATIYYKLFIDLTFHIITIFPEIFDSYFKESVLARAQKENRIKIKIYNLRVYVDDKHKTVDDSPYGGGPGMVFKVEPIYKCIEAIKRKIHFAEFGEANMKQFKDMNVKILLTSAKGVEYTQKKVKELKEYTDIIIICGRYEGIDERVAEHIVDEEISIGKYILTGGEIPAMVIVDSIARLIPDVLGNKESLASESHEEPGILDYPVYTRPEEFREWKVPKELLSGNHAMIEKWRENKKK